MARSVAIKKRVIKQWLNLFTVSIGRTQSKCINYSSSGISKFFYCWKNYLSSDLLCYLYAILSLVPLKTDGC